MYAGFNARYRRAGALHSNLRLYLELVNFWPRVCEIPTPWSAVFILFFIILLLVLLWRVDSFSYCRRSLLVMLFLRIAGVSYGRFIAMRCKLICQNIFRTVGDG